MEAVPALTNEELFARLHPRLAHWFRATYGKFTDAQLRCVPVILARETILLTSPTGSGKTLAGFLGIFDALLRELDDGPLSLGVRCLYISPLRALTYDIGKNLRAPIAGMGLEKDLLVHVRTGDTSASERAKFKRKPTPFLVTTPESLAVMLAQESYALGLTSCRFVIVDELHSFAGNKRGVDLALSLERLEELCRRLPLGGAGVDPIADRPEEKATASPSRFAERNVYNGPLCRVGLSATAAPLELLGGFLAGDDRPCRIAEAKIEKESIVEVFSPIRRKPYPPAGYTGVRLYEELAELIRSKQSVLVFTNVRSAAEQIGLRLKELLPELANQIETHHASLDRSVRLEVEDRLKDGELRAVVCSTSLEMGIDIGAVDLVVMIATPKGVSRAIQRIGRSGHSLNKSSHGVLVATNINDLVEATATALLVRQRALDPIKILAQPNDVLAQHIVGMAALRPITADDAFAIVRRAFPFRELEREEFGHVLEYLAGGGASLQRQYAGLFGKITIGPDGLISLAHPRVAREFLLNVGTIVSEGYVSVLLGRRRLGSVEESFIKQLNPGDLFVLGSRVVRLIETGVQEAYVERADGHLPTIPRWNAAKMPLTSGLAKAVKTLRTELDRRLRESTDNAAIEWLVETYQISLANARPIVEFFRAQLAISEIPAGRKFLLELYREGEHSHYFFHALIGRSANDALSRIIAWRVQGRIGGNALVTIDDYGFLLTLRRFQELPLAQWQTLFRRGEAEEDLHAALRGSELVKWQFRGVAQTGLMVPRNLPGRERKPRQLSWSSEVLFRVLEQHEPDHPLLEEAYRQATHTFLDADTAYEFLAEVPTFDWKLRELPVISPFSFPIYASKIKENMMMEDPATAIERIYFEMYSRVEQVTGNAAYRPEEGEATPEHRSG